MFIASYLAMTAFKRITNLVFTTTTGGRDLTTTTTGGGNLPITTSGGDLDTPTTSMGGGDLPITTSGGDLDTPTTSMGGGDFTVTPTNSMGGGDLTVTPSTTTGGGDHTTTNDDIEIEFSKLIANTNVDSLCKEFENLFKNNTKEDEDLVINKRVVDTATGAGDSLRGTKSVYEILKQRKEWRLSHPGQRQPTFQHEISLYKKDFDFSFSKLEIKS